MRNSAQQIYDICSSMCDRTGATLLPTAPAPPNVWNPTSVATAKAV
jgi:hypothetical protein